MNRIIVCFSWVFLLCLGCKQVEFEAEIPVYFNDFESEDLPGISAGYVTEFDGSNVMGMFNNFGFNLTLNDLPEHDFIQLSFDLYIHDTWEGNANMVDGVNLGPDLWLIEFDREEDIKAADKISFQTTFSNGLCVPSWCFSQSYPNQFPFQNDARQDALSRTEFGRCLWSGSHNGTSIYRIDKIFPHDRRNSIITFYDLLIQENDFSPLCDESWSLDNLSVSVFTTK